MLRCALFSPPDEGPPLFKDHHLCEPQGGPSREGLLHFFSYKNLDYPNPPTYTSSITIFINTCNDIFYVFTYLGIPTTEGVGKQASQQLGGGGGGACARNLIQLLFLMCTAKFNRYTTPTYRSPCTYYH